MAIDTHYGSENISRDICIALDSLLTCIVEKCVLLDYCYCHFVVLV